MESNRSPDKIDEFDKSPDVRSEDKVDQDSKEEDNGESLIQ